MPVSRGMLEFKTVIVGDTDAGVNTFLGDSYYHLREDEFSRAILLR